MPTQTLSHPSPGKFTSSSNRNSCTAWSSCAPGTRVLQEPSSSQDRTCISCENGTVSGPASHDRAMGQWQFAIASPGLTSRPHSFRTYIPGKFSSSANAGSCQAWRDCPAGTFIKTEGTSQSDRQCEPCAAGACVSVIIAHAPQWAMRRLTRLSFIVSSFQSAGTFSAVVNAGSCETMRMCPAGQFVSSAGTSVEDRACTSCPSGRLSSKHEELCSQARCDNIPHHLVYL